MTPLNISKILSPVLATTAQLDITDEKRIEALEAEIVSKIEIANANKTTSINQKYNAWKDSMLEQGWTLDLEYSVEHKSDYRLLDYTELSPVEQDAYILLLTLAEQLEPVLALENSLALENEVKALTKAIEDLKFDNIELKSEVARVKATKEPKAVTLARTGFSIKYVGPEDLFVDRLYGSGVTFRQGEVTTLPIELAKKLLNHPEFEEAKLGTSRVDMVDDVTKKQDESKKLAQHEEEAVLDLKNQFLAFTKNDMVEYAKTHYNESLDMKKTKPELHQELITLVDGRGLL